MEWQNGVHEDLMQNQDEDEAFICGISHVEEYIKLTGKGLGKVSDQIVESCHSALNKRLVASRYWIKDFESELHGKMLYRGILHFNSYNL